MRVELYQTQPNLGFLRDGSEDYYRVKLHLKQFFSLKFIEIKFAEV